MNASGVEEFSDFCLFSSPLFVSSGLLTMTTSEQIKAAISATHDAIEKLPFTTALVAGRLSRETYCLLLDQLLVVHSTLEPAIDQQAARAPSALPGVLRYVGMHRQAVLRQDLAYLRDTHLHPNQVRPQTILPQTTQLRDVINHWASTTVYQLAGALYIVEGSRMGSLAMAKPLARCLNVPPSEGHGLDYHLHLTAERFAQWKEFKNRLDSHPVSAAERQGIVDAAREMMDGMFAIYAAMPGSESVAEGAHNEPASVG